MSGLSVFIISVCLGVLVVAGIRAIINEIKGIIQDRKIKALLENDFELYLKAEKLQEEIMKRIAK
jgi:hypothetical protein